MIRIDNPSGGIPSSQTGLQDSGSQLRSGNFMGQQVIARSIESSILTDSAEEITLALSETVESKDIEDRLVEAEGLPRSMPTEEIIAYLDSSKQGNDAEAMAALAKLMTSGQGSPRELAKKGFQDITQQYLALQYAAREGEKSGASQEHMEAIYDAIADMDMDFGPRIRADLNTIGVAGGYASAEDVANFQAAFRDVVLGQQTLAQTLVAALERFGAGDFSTGMQNLIKGLGADLAAARPSTDATRLQALVQDLYHLEVAATVLDGTCALADTMVKRHGVESMDAVKVMTELVGITSEKWLAGARFTGIAERVAPYEAGAQITFLTGAKAILRDLPVKVYNDADARQSVLNAVQDALDAAIDREEE
ncbi:type III secretion system gatekeeper subunit SctW [Noviherbaspirillum sp. CPCC 100848]|uniref:Type III secretion system gatekeeper subunit SctW n=1 Tax=Noviherbaspirillum album TaxID=3080276 RepID=A0ABU6JAQ6_9BURK|nr:type III secretion system gatekeeper subunit SctW [Noviherbaspirillum sp. CPCC 100848]MEC4720742.1 type III secretion system gatekeeper subunit SctW [Noviherbaspirillum sp. CPCC 100848]